MEGLSRALGAGPTIVMGGETFFIKGKLLRRYAEIEAQIIASRPDPMKMMREGCKEFRGTKDDPGDPELLKIFVKECYEQARAFGTVTGEEVRDWLNTVRGRCFLCWIAIQHNDPDRLTLTKVTEMWLDELEAEAKRGGEEARAAKIRELETKVDQAGGEDELGNSNGCAPGTTGAAKSVGAGSSAD